MTTPTISSFSSCAAYEADYVTRDGRLVIDDPEVRRRLVKAHRQLHGDLSQGLHAARFGRPGTVCGNNKAFLAQAVVMTANVTLSIPNALKRERPEDYYKNTATIEWPLGPHGEPFPIVGIVVAAVVFKDGGNTPSPRSSSGSWSPRAGSPTGSISPATASCRRCRSCSSSRSGSTRATRIRWPR